jgi:hypothetical protein
MIQIKDKVTHPIHGNGIVENMANNESVAIVDFRGVMKWCEVFTLQKGVNTYKETEKTQSTKELPSIQKLQHELQEEVDGICRDRILSERQVVQMGEKKQIINRIEDILQGKSFKK